MIMIFGPFRTFAMFNGMGDGEGGLTFVPKVSIFFNSLNRFTVLTTPFLSKITGKNPNRRSVSSFG